MKNIPDKIYLQTGLENWEHEIDEDADFHTELDFEKLSDSGSVTWCRHIINNSDIEFISKKALKDALDAEEPYTEIMELVYGH